MRDIILMKRFWGPEQEQGRESLNKVDLIK